jgi:hypothetical protein
MIPPSQHQLNNQQVGQLIGIFQQSLRPAAALK